MKCTVFILFVILGSNLVLSAPSRQIRSIGPFKNIHPIETIRSFIFASPEEEEEHSEGDDSEVTHELISLNDFPIWRLHHYSGVDIKPVTDDEIKDIPISAEDYLSVPAVTHGDDHEDPLASLGLMTAAYEAIGGVRDAIDTLRTSIRGIPLAVLGALGLADNEEIEITDDEDTYDGSLPSLPDLHALLPAAVHRLVPSLPKVPIKLPGVVTSKNPPVYLTVKDKKPTVVAKKPVVVLQEEKLPFELPSSYESPKLHYGSPVTKLGYKAPEGMVLPLNVPDGDVHDYIRLAVAGANALSQFNSAGEAADAIESLNDLNNLGIDERSDEALALEKTLSTANERSDTVPSIESTTTTSTTTTTTTPAPSTSAPVAGHSAISVPVRDSPPPDGARGAQDTPVFIVTPESS